MSFTFTREQFDEMLLAEFSDGMVDANRAHLLWKGLSHVLDTLNTKPDHMELDSDYVAVVLYRNDVIVTITHESYENLGYHVGSAHALFNNFTLADMRELPEEVRSFIKRGF